MFALQIADLKTLQGPVYSNDGGSHHYAENPKAATDLKGLTYPMYDIDRAHNYTEETKFSCNDHSFIEGVRWQLLLSSLMNTIDT